MTIALNTPLTKRRNWSGSTRGLVSEFSRKSRLRLMRFMARLLFGQCVFVTLTYGQDFPPVPVAKRHLKEFCRRLHKLYPKSAFVWRQEFQQRGAVHFHLIITRAKFIPKSEIMMMWANVINYVYWDFTEENNGRLGPGRPPMTRIEKIRSRKKLTNYVSKYLAKNPRESADGFNDVPYLDNTFSGEVTIGRQWGVYYRENLVFALIVQTTLVYGDWYRHMTTAMGEVWAYCHRAIYRDTGFALFYDQASVWVERALTYYMLYSFDDSSALES